MRFTGADTFDDTGCWQAAAFQKCTQLSGSRLTEVPPISCLGLGETAGDTRNFEPSLYSDFSDTSRRFGRAARLIGGPEWDCPQC